jgi:glutaredoxin
MIQPFSRPKIPQRPFRDNLLEQSWTRSLASACAIAAVSLVTSCAPDPFAEVPAPRPTSSFERGLAQHLQATGAVMYGAYWCPYCARQKESFKEAVSLLPYVECDPAGQNAQPQRCADKQIRGFPTWEIEGKLYPGQRSLQELADMSQYQAPPRQP